MAIPVLRAQFLKRSSGHSAVGAAAYRARERIYDERERKVYDFTKKKDIVHSEIMAPGNAPDWLKERKELWNAVEAVEKRKDSQLAQEVVVALPRELDREQNKELVRDYVQNQFVDKGMIADIAIHEPRSEDGGKNPHAHIMLTLRDVNEKGFGKKNRDWNDGRKGQRKVALDEMRDNWENHINRHLSDAGSNERISMKSYEEQGVDRKPQQHMGRHAWYRERRMEEKSYIGDHNRKVQQDNHERDYINAARARRNENPQRERYLERERKAKMEMDRVREQEQTQEREREERGMER